jgi:hypothetical protein
MPTGQIADSCVLWTGFDISIVVRDPTAHLPAGEAWLWVAVFAAVMLVQSAALSLQAGVEVAYVDAEQPDQAPARPSS